MSILITGGAGYIGSHTCVELLQAGHEVVVFDNFSNSHPEALRRVEHIVGKELSIVRGDVRNQSAIEAALRQHRCQAVIHFAGLKAVGRRNYLNVWGNDYPTPDGTGVRDYIHVVDLAKGHLKALEKIDSPQCTAVNLGTGIGYSVLDVVKAFEAASGQTIPYQLSPRRPGDVAACYADPSLAAQLLDWKAERDLATMCQDHWRWQKQNPQRFLHA